MSHDLPPVAYVERGAELSPCGTYRYTLTRVWDPFALCVLWVCLNPSKANASEDDPSARKVVGFSRRWGFGSATIVNLYAFRATDPRDLERAGRPIGPENDRHILAAFALADAIVCAWGQNEPKDSLRPVALRRLLSEAKRTADCLGRAKNGQPRHPLMLSYDTPRERYYPNITEGLSL